MYKCVHFGIRELVSKVVYDKFKEQAWMFFSPLLLQDLDTIREANGAAIKINDWYLGGTLSQCGLRSNMDPLVKDAGKLYCSAHTMGKAFDLHDSLGRNKRLWTIVHNLITQKKLKAVKRIESIDNTATWVHVDEFQADTPVFRA